MEEIEWRENKSQYINYLSCSKTMINYILMCNLFQQYNIQEEIKPNEN